jgi:hypothetical protein
MTINYFKNLLRYFFVVTIIITFVFSQNHFAQIESSTLILNRGKLWQTVSFGKTGPSFSNWSQRGIGLDWPGFDPSLISENIGGSASHLVTGGMYVGAKFAPDSILSVEDWSLYGSSIGEGAGSKYTVTKHARIYPNGSNYWLQTNPSAGEEVIESVWEYNINYQDEFQIKRMLPIRVRRTTHQWSGSKLDENYIIHEYVIKNISPEIRSKVPAARFVADTLYDFYAVINYGLHVNSRSWSVMFPSLTPGARNTWFEYDGARRSIRAFADDYKETPGTSEKLGLVQNFGPIVDGQPTGEYLAPASAGVRLLYASRNKSGQESRITRFGWSSASNSIDLSGPLTNLGSLEAQYGFVSDIRLAANFVQSPGDTTLMRRTRMWSMMQLGPWNILPNDSIVIVIAEIVDGVDYKIAISPDPQTNSVDAVALSSRTIFNTSSDRALLTYNNRYQHPSPPAAPKFNVDYSRESNSVANIITWGTEAEQIPDPHDGTFDLEGYNIYRSDYLPIGAWTLIGTVTKGDLNYLNGNLYTFIDSTVSIGQGYYYALTSFDSGKPSWTGVQTINNIPKLETSIFANRTQLPFVATIPAKPDLSEILVVPNPFIIGEGQSQPGAEDQIQFVNLPNPCTIRIYTVRGDIVKTIQVAEGTGAIVSWDQVTDYGQFIESGIYIFHVEYSGGTKLGKFAVVR